MTRPAVPRAGATEPSAVEAALAQLALDARQRRLLPHDITTGDARLLLAARRRTLPPSGSAAAA